MESFNIKGHDVEYIDESHTYLVDGIVVSSITTLLKNKFGNKYDFVKKEVLDEASKKGTMVHKKIEDYCTKGIDDTECIELRNFKFLQRMYKFNVKENEVPVILFIDNKPVAAGRLDLVLEINGEVGGGDIKRTSTLDKEYLAYQLNLYRVAYKQCYDVEWKFLKALHLRENTRKFVDIPIAEDVVIDYVKDILKLED